MTQKSLKIKISVGNDAAKARRSATSPKKDEYVILGPNYPGIAAVLLIGGVIFGGGWWLFSSSEEVVSQTALQQNTVVGNEPVIAAASSLQPETVAVDVMRDDSLASLPSTKETATAEKEIKTQVAAPVNSITSSEPKPLEQAQKQTQPQPVLTQPAEVKMSKPDQYIARAQFTNGVYKREPVDSLQELSLAGVEQGAVKVFFFSELRGLAGKTVTHRWLYEDKEVAKIKFRVGSDRWRVYSSKNIQSNKTGAWKVTINDAAGGVLYSDELIARE